MGLRGSQIHMPRTYENIALQRASKEAANFDLNRNRRSFKDLKKLIEKLRINPFGRIDLLSQLQNQLANRILRTEKGLKIVKAERLRILGLRKSRPSKEILDVLKKRITTLDDRIEQGKYLLWIWRCFGDAIPFIYHDKHVLKHMFYSIEDYSVKQSAGALSGNDGRRLESKIMQAICRNGIPAVLCDLTNTLRHGDVCVMVNADPFPIEVKSSANQNARTVRQASNLASLHSFFAKDKATNFRGVERVERRETSLAEAHVTELNRCIEESRNNLLAVAHPEEGLTYVAFRSGVNFKCIENVELGKHPDVLIWNDAIKSEAWMPYYPFTLSVQCAADLIALLEGRLVIIAALDSHSVMSRFADRGFIATFTTDENVALTIRRLNASINNDGPECGVSTHLIRRVLFECEPIDNFVNFSLKFIEELEATKNFEPGESSERDAQMMAAWHKLEPKFPPLLTDDADWID